MDFGDLMSSFKSKRTQRILLVKETETHGFTISQTELSETLKMIRELQLPLEVLESKLKLFTLMVTKTSLFLCHNSDQEITGE